MMSDSTRGLIPATVWLLLVWRSSCDYPKLEGGMTAANSFTLHCTKKGGWGITRLNTVYWYRNETLVFYTYNFVGSSVYILNSTFVNPVHLTWTWRTHTVTVSDVQEGRAIWRCNNDRDTTTWSNSVELLDYTADVKNFTLSTPNPQGGNVTLNVYPDKIYDGNNFTASCTVETVGELNISAVVWLQNSTEVIATISNGSHLILANSSTPAVVAVTQSYNQHNLTVVATHTLNGTYWTCAVPVLSVVSNTLLIQVMEPTGNVSLDVYPGEIQSGSNVSLSCTVETEDPVRASQMTWRQNYEEHVVTFRNGSYDIVGNSTSNVVLGLIASDSQHNLTVWTQKDDLKSTTWNCGIEKWQWYSNNVSINVWEQVSTIPDLTVSPPTPDSNNGHQSLEDKTQLYTIIGSTVGVVALTVIIAGLVIRNRKKADELEEPNGSGQKSAPSVGNAEVIEMKANVIYESGPDDRHADEKVMKENSLYESSPVDINQVDRDKVMKDNSLYESSPVDINQVDRDKVMKENSLYESSPVDINQVDRDKVMKDNSLYESSPVDINQVDRDKVMKENDLYDSAPTDSER